jgi:hypothetical protein
MRSKQFEAVLSGSVFKWIDHESKVKGVRPEKENKEVSPAPGLPPGGCAGREVASLGTSDNAQYRTWPSGHGGWQ